jgi:hypothetical protein
MSVPTYKIMVLVMTLVIAFTGVACGCDHGDEEGPDLTTAEVVCHHGESAPSDHHDRDEHDDGCSCATTMLLATVDHVGSPNLRPTMLVSMDFMCNFSYLDAAAPFLPVNSCGIPAASTCRHRDGTSLLRQHCALII